MDGGKFTVFDRSVLVSNGRLHGKVCGNILQYIDCSSCLVFIALKLKNAALEEDRSCY